MIVRGNQSENDGPNNNININVASAQTQAFDLTGGFNSDADVYVYAINWTPSSADAKIAYNATLNDIKYIHSDNADGAGVIFFDGDRDWIYDSTNDEFLPISRTNKHQYNLSQANTIWLSTNASTTHLPDNLAFTLTLASGGNGTAAVKTPLPSGVTDNQNGSYAVDNNTELQIEASPATDYHFVQWQDNNSNNPRTITVTENATYTATFAINQYRIDSIPTSWRVAIGEGTPFSPTPYGNEHPDSGYVMIPVGAEFLIIPSENQKHLVSKLELIDKTPPTGALSGLFSVSATKQVYFSQGNLRATNTTANSTSGWTWSFAEHQYDYIGDNIANNALGNNAVTTAGTVDLFGWVGSHSSLAAYGINNNNTDSNYGNITSETLKSDWGHNVITNGGNAPDLWRTLSKDEWVWLVGPSSSANPGTNCRTSSTVDGTANARFTYATINGTYKGMIIFPDSYTAGTPSGVTWGPINSCSDYTTTCTPAGWTALEAAGCVFLPAAGVRNGNTMFDPPSSSNPRGNYWSSTSHESNANNAYSMHFFHNTFNPENNYKRSDGYSVRLVRDAE